MRNTKLGQFNQAGDTILEVLIAMAVVSLTLSTSFASANRSLSNSRQSQERVIALKLAETQIEMVKNLVITDPAQVFDATPYCFELSGAKKYIGYSPTTNLTDNATVKTNFTQHDADAPGCVQDGLFYPAILYDPLTNLFTVIIRWTTFNSSTYSESRIVYRMYK